MQAFTSYPPFPSYSGSVLAKQPAHPSQQEKVLGVVGKTLMLAMLTELRQEDRELEASLGYIQ